MTGEGTGAGVPQSLLGGEQMGGAPGAETGAAGSPLPPQQSNETTGSQGQTPPLKMPQSPQEKAAPQPVEYGKFNIPEGFDYNDGKVNEFTTLARELNLSQDQAQKLVDLHVRHWLGFEEQTLKQQEDWRNQTMNDPEFGGQKFTQSLGDAMRFINSFGGDKLKAVLDETGVGNHPVIFSAFAKAGRLLGEDRLVTGAGAAGARGGTFADLANSMYPDMKNGGNN